MVVNHPDQLANRVIVKSSSTHLPPGSGSQRKKVVAKRAVDKLSMCCKCNSPCSDANRPGNVRCFSLHVVIEAVFQMRAVELFVYDPFL